MSTASVRERCIARPTSALGDPERRVEGKCRVLALVLPGAQQIPGAEQLGSVAAVRADAAHDHAGEDEQADAAADALAGAERIPRALLEHHRGRHAVAPRALQSLAVEALG